MISSQFPLYFVQQGAEKCVFGCTEQAHGEGFKCFSKDGGFAIFLAAKPSVLLRNSGLGLKVTRAR